MISMADLLKISKQIIDEYEGVAELTPPQEYGYKHITASRNAAVKKYIKDQNYYDNNLLEVCQRYILDKAFLILATKLFISKVQMGDEPDTDIEGYLN